MIATISTLWQGLAVLEKIYWLIAIPFSVLFIIQTVLTFIGGDGMEAEGDADLAIEGDSGIPFQFLSIKNLIAFFTIFGWVGIVTYGNGTHPVFSVMWAILSGLLMMTVMAALMYFMGKLTENGTMDLKKITGKTGTVYLSIPASRGGVGKVQINFRGFQTLDAMTDDEETIPTGGVAEVLDVLSGEVLLVRKSAK